MGIKTREIEFKVKIMACPERPVLRSVTQAKVEGVEEEIKIFLKTLSINNSWRPNRRRVAGRRVGRVLAPPRAFPIEAHKQQL